LRSIGSTHDFLDPDFSSFAACSADDRSGLLAA
jgi:hypothetical protein